MAHLRLRSMHINHHRLKPFARGPRPFLRSLTYKITTLPDIHQLSPVTGVLESAYPIVCVSSTVGSASTHLDISTGPPIELDPGPWLRWMRINHKVLHIIVVTIMFMIPVRRDGEGLNWRWIESQFISTYHCLE